jgi:hypothetical protein
MFEWFRGYVVQYFQMWVENLEKQINAGEIHVGEVTGVIALE